MCGNCQGCYQKSKLSIVAEIRWLRDHDRGHIVDWWIGEEAKRGRTFRKDISYKDLAYLADQAERQLTMLDGESDFSCPFCAD